MRGAETRWRIAFGVVLATMTSAIYAQSSVTLYGVVDVGIDYANHQSGNGSSVVRMSSGNIAGSRWGLRGVEELGGGLRTVFVLENGFDADTGKAGQGGRMFGRMAYVGLQGNWGSLLFGRQQSSLFDYIGNYDPMTLATKYSIFTQDPAFIQRSDNTVKYIGSFGALKASALYSPGTDSNVANGSEVPGNAKLGREFGGYLTYDIGRLSVATAYDEINTGTLVQTPDAKVRRASTAVTYLVGPTKLFVGHRWAKGYNGGVVPGAIMGNDNQGSNLYWAGINWQVTPTVTLAGAAYFQDFKNTGSDPWLFAANAEYAFSKRTRLYASVAYTKNKGTSALGIYDGGKSFGNTNPGQNQLGALVGMRHSF